MRRSEKLALLREILAKRRPDLILLIEKSDIGMLTNEQINELNDVLLDEFNDNGLQDDYEPNQYGLDVEDVIDLLLGYLKS